MPSTPALRCRFRTTPCCPSDSRAPQISGGTCRSAGSYPCHTAHSFFALRPMCSRRVSRCREFYPRGGARYRAPFQSHRALPCRGRCCGRREFASPAPPARWERRTCYHPAGSRRRPDTVENRWQVTQMQVPPPVVVLCRPWSNADSPRAHSNRGGNRSLNHASCSLRCFLLRCDGNGRRARNLCCDSRADSKSMYLAALF